MKIEYWMAIGLAPILIYFLIYLARFAWVTGRAHGEVSGTEAMIKCMKRHGMQPPTPTLPPQKPKEE